MVIERKMWSVQCTILLLLLFSNFLDLSRASCDVKRNRTNEHDFIANCRALKDARLISIHDLHTLNAVPEQKLLHSETFRRFASLRHLNLSNGNLKKIEPGTFAKLGNLETLNLEHNVIGDLKIGTFKGLKSLRSLNLGYNAIPKLSWEVKTLTNLRFLNLTGNPLECNCASLKFRDALVKKDVRISEGSLCSSPTVLKGKSFNEPATHEICAFEQQDTEMLMDEPLAFGEGSGDDGSDYKDEDDDNDYKDDNDLMSSSSTTSETPAPLETPAPSQSSTSSETPATSSSEPTGSMPEVTSEAAHSTSDDSLILIDDSKESESSKLPLHNFEGSGEVAKVAIDEGDEGSGDDEGSGSGVPHIDWSQVQDDSKNDSGQGTGNASTTEEGILDSFQNFPNKLLDMFGLFGTTSSEKELNHATESSSSTYLEEEQFFPISTGQSISAEKETAKTETSTSRVSVTPTPTNQINDASGKLIIKDKDAETREEAGDASQSRQSKKSVGSYLVLAILLTVMASLIGYAAYKGDLCRKKPERRDVENGTELKDLQKSLLDGTASQPKITSNGNMEIVPLVSEKPFENCCEVAKSAEDLKLQDLNEPVKPPRKSMQQEDFDKVKTNGTNQPDLPGLVKTYLTEAPVPRNLSSDESVKPQVSPGAQRVKITLQDNPDSVPKTPVLITRLKNDGSLVKAP